MVEPPGSFITLLFNSEETYKSFIKHNKHLVYYITTRFKNGYKECVISVREKDVLIKLDNCKNQTLLLGHVRSEIVRHECGVTKNNFIHHTYVSLEHKTIKHDLDYCSVHFTI